eukprot:ANDGO_00055.mRNA.1 hypothetical protein SARC_00134
MDHPIVAIARADQAASVRQSLNLILGNRKLHKDPVAAFDRRLFQCRTASRDPLFPDSMFCDGFLKDDLMKAGVAEEQEALAIGNSVKTASKLAAMILKQCRQLCEAEASLEISTCADLVRLERFADHDFANVVFSCTEFRRRIDAKKWAVVLRACPTLASADTILLSIDPALLDRLRKTFHENCKSMKGFALHLFLLMYRYDTLGGPGYQGALPDDVFELLRNTFDVSVESFASPLNRVLPHFCSAFPDTDAIFGSLGSFFAVDRIPEGSNGSFEANPPFDLSFMADFVDHMTRLLKTPKPCSFVVIVPAYKKDAEYWAKLATHPMLRLMASLGSSKHAYKEGFHYRLRKKLRMAEFETGVFVIQNDAGAKNWPIPKDFKTDLHTAFDSEDAPSSSAKTAGRKCGDTESADAGRSAKKFRKS